VRDGEGRVLEWLGTSTDVDDILQLQQQQIGAGRRIAASHAQSDGGGPGSDDADD
jgi:hypothetical protein